MREMTPFQKKLKKAERVLKKQDPKLGKLIAMQKITPNKPRADYFASLSRSIIGQQVSTHAAAAIHERFAEVTGEQPERVKKMTQPEAKKIGLSRQKVGYLKDLSRHFLENPKIYEHLESQTDEEVIGELTAVKGIGKWTAQMFLIFTLERPDVFAPDDAGLARAVEILYHFKKPPTKKELERVSDKWRPYRTLACFHLWHSLHNMPK